MKSGAVKEMAVRSALDTHQRRQGELTQGYARRIAEVAGASASYVLWVMSIRRYETIGAALRAQEAAEAKGRCQVLRPGLEVGPVRNFTGWPDTFARLKVLAEAYLNLAQSRGDVYAAAFLKDIREVADRAQERAARSLTA